MERACASCGRPLFAKNRRDLARKRFCSHRCKAITLLGGLASYQALAPSKTCERCKEEFRPTSGRQRFCGARCRNCGIAARFAQRHNSLEAHLTRLIRFRPGRGDLTLAMLLQLHRRQAGKCAMSGVPMTWEVGQGKVPTNISIDRINPDLPYAADNIQLVCQIINIMRNKLSVAGFVDWCRAVVAEADGAIN